MHGSGKEGACDVRSAEERSGSNKTKWREKDEGREQERRGNEAGYVTGAGQAPGQGEGEGEAVHGARPWPRSLGECDVSGRGEERVHDAIGVQQAHLTLAPGMPSASSHPMLPCDGQPPSRRGQDRLTCQARRPAAPAAIGPGGHQSTRSRVAASCIVVRLLHCHPPTASTRSSTWCNGLGSFAREPAIHLAHMRFPLPHSPWHDRSQHSLPSSSSFAYCAELRASPAIRIRPYLAPTE